MREIAEARKRAAATGIINRPDYSCETSGIKFANNGTGHSALLKVPAGGRLQWVPFCGYMKLFTVDQEPDLIPGELSSLFAVGLTPSSPIT